MPIRWFPFQFATRGVPNGAGATPHINNEVIVHDDATRYPALLAIVLVCTAVFLAGQVGDEPTTYAWGAVPAKLVAAWDNLLAGQIGASLVAEGVTLVTALFLHGSVEHILFNMVFLWAFGVLVTQYLGQWPAIACFFICGVCGNLLQTALEPESERVIIGASCAVSGYEGIYLGLALRWALGLADVWPLAHPVPPIRLCVFALVGIAGDVYWQVNGDEAIAYGGHIGGFVSGFLIAATVTQIYPTREAYRRRVRWA